MSKPISIREVRLGPAPGPRARIGLISLGSGMTTEAELHQILALDGVLMLTTRVRDNDTVSLAELAAMEADLRRAASTIQPVVALDVVAYGCTSGAIAIGEDKLADHIRFTHPDSAITNQFRSSIVALQAVGASRIAIVSPYTLPVTVAMRDHVEAAGIEVTHAVAFGLSQSSAMCSVLPSEILAATVEAGSKNVDAVFICCGGLRSIGILAEAERRLEKPVISSNQSLAWHALRLAGVQDHLVGHGQLFNSPLVASAGRDFSVKSHSLV